MNINPGNGLGHLIRCLRIAKKIDKKFNIIFVTDHLPKKELIKKYLKKYEIISLYKHKNNFVNENNDAKKFLSKLSIYKKDIIFVDDYRIGAKWTKKIKIFTKKLIIIDDLANKNFFCDYYINYKSNKNNLLKKKVEKKLDKNCNLLIGDKYSIISSELRKSQNLSGKIKIMINFGNDFDFSTIKNFIKNFIKIKKINNYKIYICIGLMSKNYNYLFRIQNKNIRIIYKKIFIEKFLNKTNIFIGSCGNALYEMSYLNVPSVFFSLNDNQKNNIYDLEEYGHYFLLEKNNLKNDNIINFLENFLLSYKRICKLNSSKKKNLKKNGINLILKKTKII